MNAMLVDSVNQVQRLLCANVMSEGVESKPRGMLTRELLGISFCLENPRQRMTTLAARGWRPALAIGELLWHIRGDTSVEPLAFYSSRWREFADINGEVRGSCYGAHIFSPEIDRQTQWEKTRTLLQKDPDTRRAVLSFRKESDVSQDTNDLSCVNTLQFLLRDGKLHAFVSMRSNDLIWGVPYDVFLFTALQEKMALELSVELGRYHHHSASMHIYERHFSLAEDIVRSNSNHWSDGQMPPMESGKELEILSQREAILRKDGFLLQQDLPPFSSFCAEILRAHAKKIPQAA